ncbi:hypothetical protein Ancab_033846 [Ancistrocladus abbreviatus]
MDGSSSSSRVDRKTIEKNRRDQMKALFTKLNSLVPHRQGSSSREVPISLPDQIDEAIKYIKRQQTNLEKLKEKRNSLQGMNRSSNNYTTASSSGGGSVRLTSPQVEVHEKGSALEVILVTGLDCQAVFKEAIRVLHEEGLEVVHANFSVVEHNVFHTVHAKVPLQKFYHCSCLKNKLHYDTSSFVLIIL